MSGIYEEKLFFSDILRFMRNHQILKDFMEFCWISLLFLKSAFLHDFSKTHAICLEFCPSRKSLKKKYLVKCFLSIYHTTKGGMIDRLDTIHELNKKGDLILMILKSQIPQVGDFWGSDLGFWGNLEILINFTFLRGFAPRQGGGACLKKVESQTHVWNI